MSSDHARTIVVGYDGSDASRAALRFAARQAGSGGKVFIVHAFELPADLLGWPDYNELLVKRENHGAALLRDLRLDDAELAGPVYETELIGGPAAKALDAVARTRNADAIIVGSRGLSHIRELLGSVSHELLHIADRPVVVIPAAAVKP